MEPNPMMAALQQSRQSNPVSSSGPMPGSAPAQAPTQGPDLSKMSSAIDAIGEKIDKLLEAFSGQYTGKNPDMNDGNDGKEEVHERGSGGY